MAPPACTWCSATAVAQLRLGVPFLRLIPPGYYPACPPHLISEGIRFATETGWPVSVKVVPLPDERPGASEAECRVVTAIINDLGPDDRHPMSFEPCA